MRKLATILFCLCGCYLSAQTKFAYGFNSGVGFTEGTFIKPNTTAGLKTIKGAFVKFNLEADWQVDKNLRIGALLGMDAYKNIYQFDEFEYIYNNHPDLYKSLKNVGRTIRNTGSPTNFSLAANFSYEINVNNKLAILPHITPKINIVALNRDTTANGLTAGSPYAQDFAFQYKFYNYHWFTPSFIFGTRLRYKFSKKYLFQFGVGGEFVTKYLNRGFVRVNYLGKDNREQVGFRGNNFQMTIGLLRFR